MNTLRLTLILAFLLATLAAVTPALADGHAGVNLEPLPPSGQEHGQESIVLAARLTDGDAPVAGVPITFYVVTDVFGERLMKVGEALSDATGTASVLYEPRWEGDHTVVARFAGTGDVPATQATFHFDAAEAVPGFEAPQFGLEPVRRWLPLAVGIAVLGVWGALGFALATTLIGIPAAGARVPAPQPLPPWDARVRRPAPLGKALLGMAALLAVAAIPTAMVIGRARAPEGVTLSTQDIHFEHDGTPAGGIGGEAEPVTLPEAGEFPATLVSSLPTTAFDESGQPAPGSVAMPSDIAVMAGRVRILDATKGRIVTVTPEQTLATILDAAKYKDVPLSGAPAMATLGEKLYVATQDARVLVVNSDGKVEGIIALVLPQAGNPPLPGGITITPRGGIWLSDSANHRVVLLDSRGQFEQVIGKGQASADPEGLNMPGGVTTDEDGNLYVADTGNRVVKKFSPLGVLLQTLGEGRLARPTSVAVGEDGTVFVTDEGAHVVSAFGADGTYAGALGEGLLEAPHSVKTERGLVYVMDRLAGLFVFQPEAAFAGRR